MLFAGQKNLAKIEEVSIEPCDKQPCVLHKGKNIIFQFKGKRWPLAISL